MIREVPNTPYHNKTAVPFFPPNPEGVNHGGWVFLSINWNGFPPNVFCFHCQSLKSICYPLPKVLRPSIFYCWWPRTVEAADLRCYRWMNNDIHAVHMLQCLQKWSLVWYSFLHMIDWEDGMNWMTPPMGCAWRSPTPWGWLSAKILTTQFWDIKYPIKIWDIKYPTKIMLTKSAPLENVES